MTVDDWPILCQNKQCRGTATPAEWMAINYLGRKIYVCQHHANRLFSIDLIPIYNWVKLTPNQRPSQVQEVQSGSHD